MLFIFFFQKTFCLRREVLSSSIFPPFFFYNYFHGDSYAFSSEISRRHFLPLSGDFAKLGWKNLSFDFGDNAEGKCGWKPSKAERFSEGGVGDISRKEISLGDRSGRKVSPRARHCNLSTTPAWQNVRTSQMRPRLV